MQGTPYDQLLEGYPFVLSRETDTATPRQQVPIYYIHTLNAPFCQNALCVCQCGRNDAAMLLGHISEGVYLLEAAQHINGIPQPCLHFGHSWKLTDTLWVKECSLCGVRGYCPGCTPIAPHGAQPFSCTAHTQQREV